MSSEQGGLTGTPSSTTTMVTQFSGSCLDISGSSHSVGGGLDEWNCTGASNQEFTFTPVPGGYYTIKPHNDDLCLDAGVGSITTGVQVVQNTCSGTDSQKWKVILNSDASYTVTTPDGSGCIDVYAGRTANGTIVTTYACHGSNNERFILSGLSASTSTGTASSSTTMVTQFSGSCLTIGGGSQGAGAGLDEWSCTGASDQEFAFTAVSGGYYTIQPNNDHLCLDAGTGSVTTGVQIVQNACSGANSQKWKVILNTDASYTVTTPDGSGCIDVYAGRTANGTIVTTYACHGSSNERFTLSGFSASSAGTAPPPPSGPGPAPSPSAARVFNAPTSANAAEIISLQGSNFGSSPKVWLDTTGAPLELPVINQVGTTWLAAQLPSTLPIAAIRVHVDNGVANGPAIPLNAALPYHLDARTLVPGGAFRVFGRSLLVAGATPVVTVGGQAAQVNVGASNERMLVATAPAGLAAASNVTITVDNGSGGGPATLDRATAVVTGSGDPFALGVGWAAAFAPIAANVVNAQLAANGTTDDTAALQSQIYAVAADGGGVLQLPASNEIRLASSIEIPSNVVLRGAGAGSTTLRYESKWLVTSTGFDRLGLMDLTVENNGSTETMILENSTRVFMKNVTIRTGAAHQAYLSGNTDMVVTGCEFLQTGTLDGNGPLFLGGTQGLVFTDNRITLLVGSAQFHAVHDAYVANNHITRDSSDQNLTDQSDGAVHLMAVDFAYRVAIVGNIFDTVNGQVTNLARNDGETILTEGGGASRTENLGTVTSATTTTLTDTSNTINTDPFSDGSLPENYAVWIVGGTGAGQMRYIAGYSGHTITVDHAWDLLPDSTSRYATFVTGLEKSVIQGNTLTGNSRGIWLYQTGVRDVDIIQNTLSNNAGIYLRAWQQMSSKMFDALYNVRIDGNCIVDTGGTNTSYLAAVFVKKDETDFGTALLGLSILGNQLTANSPNFTTNSSDYAGLVEGYRVWTQFEGSTWSGESSPWVMGPIVQDDTSINADVAFTTGTGVIGPVLSRMTRDNSPTLLSNDAVGGASTGATSLVEQ